MSTTYEVILDLAYLLYLFGRVEHAHNFFWDVKATMNYKETIQWAFVVFIIMLREAEATVWRPTSQLRMPMRDHYC